ncbi:hypothetical protein DAPPUDRAFT_245976 [Daphnia pulex]|uniref:Uncharacterized protein n=1 Tax=Daphnia pulex TaxID=6669 RepID=E9GPE5_DAPPU|nr:hypothetical protein DAPPUDRAFT_245976 [Daphnia pulex]|eukprot:EFX78693.1 hypothetical protein DAPPUDRAFT_245976 [Daphnia pulex]
MDNISEVVLNYTSEAVPKSLFVKDPPRDLNESIANIRAFAKRAKFDEDEALIQRDREAQNALRAEVRAAKKRKQDAVEEAKIRLVEKEAKDKREAYERSKRRRVEPPLVQGNTAAQDTGDLLHQLQAAIAAGKFVILGTSSNPVTSEILTALAKHSGPVYQPMPLSSTSQAQTPTPTALTSQAQTPIVAPKRMVVNKKKAAASNKVDVESLKAPALLSPISLKPLKVKAIARPKPAAKDASTVKSMLAKEFKLILQRFDEGNPGVTLVKLPKSRGCSVIRTVLKKSCLWKPPGRGQPVPAAAPPGAPQVGAADAAVAPPLLGRGQPQLAAAPPGAPQVGAAAAAIAPPLLGCGQPVPAAAPPRAPQVGATAAAVAPRLVVGAAAAAIAPRLLGRGQPQLAAAPPGAPQVGAAAAAIAPRLVGQNRPRPAAAPPGAPQVGAAAAAIAPRLVGRGQPQLAAVAAPLVGQRGPRLACHMMVQYDMFNFLTNQVGTAAIIRSVETENGFLTTVTVPGDPFVARYSTSENYVDDNKKEAATIFMNHLIDLGVVTLNRRLRPEPGCWEILQIISNAKPHHYKTAVTTTKLPGQIARRSRRIIESETESETELILTAEEEEEVLKNLALSTISARQVGRNSRGSG